MSILDKDDFTQEDIQNLIDSKAEESLYIEFKSAGSLSMDEGKKKEMAKDVSAFANSDGGLLFYGIIESDHIASGLSFIDGNRFSKEWIENVLISKIQPRIEKLKIIPIRFDSDPNKTIYVIKIPSLGPGGPYMSKENKYYRRCNFQSVPMEEYEVRRSYNIPNTSKLEFDELMAVSTKINDKIIYIDFLLNLTNIGKTVCNSYKAACWLYNLEDCSISYEPGLHCTKTIDGTKISTSSLPPIFPNEVLTTMEFTIGIPISEYLSATKNVTARKLLFYNNSFYAEDIDVKRIFKRIYDKLTLKKK